MSFRDATGHAAQRKQAMSELLEGLKKRRWFFSKVERITETTVRKTGQLGIKQDAYLVVGREKKQVLTVVMVMVCSSRIML